MRVAITVLGVLGLCMAIAFLALAVGDAWSSGLSVLLGIPGGIWAARRHGY